MASLNPSEPNLLALLSTQAQSLFALLDAAKDSQILELLQRLDQTDYQSLYEGKTAEQLAGFAPYLVSLSANTSFLEKLVETGWGESWGLYLTSEQPFSIIRQHLRELLVIKNQSGKQLYFRFYDPRVLRKFLPTCAPEQLKAFFGPIQFFFIEGVDKDQMLQFQWQPTGLKCHNVFIKH